MAFSEHPGQVVHVESSDTAGRVTLRRVAVWARRKPLGAAGAVIVLGMLLVALLAPLIAPYDPVRNAFDRMHLPPSAAHWFGTDQFGRDVLSRLLHGARTALLVGLVASFLGASAGLMLGVASAYFGGRFDLLFQRLMDILMAFPLIIMALAIVSIFGTGTHNVIAAITVPFIPRCARVVRASAPRRAGASLRRRRPRLRFQPRPHHAVPRGAERHGALPHHADGVPGPGHPAGSLAFVPRARRPGTHAGLGPDAPGRRGGIRRKRPLDGDISRSGDYRLGLRLQSLRRRRARYPGSAAAFDGVKDRKRAETRFR